MIIAINALFKIYAKEIGYNIQKLHFIYNAITIDCNDQREISQVFGNAAVITVMNLVY